ncbi:MAG TPA: hypothetical protein PK737_03165, partial [Bacilli bacterium]|nr:hypothetical protein [Bacilli bacterium]
ISFILTIGTTIFIYNSKQFKVLWIDNYYLLVSNMMAINIILVIVFTILLIIMKKITKVSLLFPISYLGFCLVMALIAIYYNDIVGVSWMHYLYFLSFIFIDYLLLNIYSLISLLKS